MTNFVEELPYTDKNFPSSTTVMVFGNDLDHVVIANSGGDECTMVDMDKLDQFIAMLHRAREWSVGFKGSNH